MKHYLISTILLLVSIVTHGQVYTASQAADIVPGAEKVVLDKETGLVKLAVFEPPVAIIDPERAGDWLTEILNIEDGSQFEVIDEKTDRLGYRHVKYRQSVNQVPVEHSAITVHAQGGTIRSISGVYYSGLGNISTNPTISQEEALVHARDHMKARVIKSAEGSSSFPQLVVFSVNGAYHLAYKADVYAIAPLSRKYIYVNANTGEILKSYSRLHDTNPQGTAETRYSGDRTIITDSLSSGSFRLHDYSRGEGIITLDMNSSTNYASAEDIIDSDNYWESENHDADAALDAHWGTQMTYDFFMETFGHNSFDNAGSALFSYVDFDNSFGNAFWDGERMTYGAGNSIYTPLTSIDVVGHEITHGVTEYSANLIYEYESGALNESFSDIFGVLIDFYARGDDGNYLIGDEISAVPLRSMENPNLHQNPDTYQGAFWEFGSFDNGGVHINSGVQNYWFYLLAEGGAGENDNGDAYFVNGIGREAAASIAYRNLTVYLTAGSDYFDARMFSIQSALDLYGECSEEVIAVTDAWHAVGMGDVFNDAVIAHFSPSSNYFCQFPANISFDNQSVNGTSWFWDFGDGNTSTEEYPVHEYTSAGTYSVSLITSGSSICGDSDTLELSELVTITDDGGPITPACQPATLSPSSMRGIGLVVLGDIDNSSGTSVEGYEDFSCESSTILIEGQSYPALIDTYSNEIITVWIDLNGDGNFSTDELVFSAPEALLNHAFDMLIPEGIVFDEPVRLRVQSSQTPLSGSCAEPIYGQVEDYSVTILENNAPPVALFNASGTVVQAGEAVTFSDLSLNLPDSWQWFFEGASETSSTQQNPTVQYSETGSYDVTLIVSNEHGADTALVEDYIVVVNSVNMCDQTNSSAPFGELYDSGGPDGNYSNNENCSLHIAPGCAQSITLSFDYFALEGCCDYFRVYDGSDSSAPLLMNANGSSLPDPVTGESGELYIVFTSDFSVTYGGWSASWESETPTTEPESIFAVSNNNPPLNTPVSFIDESTEFPSQWEWDFGDGNTSNQQNPGHNYSLPGEYTVTQVVHNCFSSDTSTQQIIVQDGPQMSIVPADTLFANVACGGATSETFTIYNTGEGDLEYSFELSGVNSSIQVLALTSLADYNNEYTNTIDAINQHFTDYELTESDAMTSAQLESDLENMDLLLIPEQESNPGPLFSSIATALDDFVASGGRILFCGNEFVYNTNLFESGYNSYTTSSSLVNIDPEHPVMTDVPATFQASNATFFYNWSDDESAVPLSALNSNQDWYTVAYKQIGEGLVVYAGFDFYEVSDLNAQIIGNAMQFLAEGQSTGWLESFSPDSTTVISPGDSLVVTVQFNAEDLLAGDYYYDGVILSNDLENDSIPYVFHLEVTGEANLNVDTTVVDFDPLMVSLVDQQTVVVYNQGCDSLVVEVAASGEGFSVEPEYLEIAGFSQDTLTVTFSPDVPGLYSGQIELTSNGGSETIVLSGEGLPSPEILIVPPDTLYTTLDCGVQGSETITIYNNGDGELEVNLMNTNAGLSSAVQVLALTTLTDYDEEYPNTLTAINQHFTEYELTESDASTSEELEADLEGIDLLLIPEQETGAISLFSAISTALNEFVIGGGRILICGNNSLDQTNLFESVYYNNSTATTLATIDTAHPIMADVPEVFPGSNATFFYEWGLDESVIPLCALNSIQNRYVVAHKEIGTGSVVFVGFDYYGITAENAQIIGNAMQFLAQGLPPVWLESVSPDTATVSPGDSLVVTVELNAEELVAGNYYYNGVILSNDPENDSIPYVFHLEVTGEAQLSVSADELDFGSLMTGLSDTQHVVVYNTACDSLTLDFSLSSDHFYIDPTFTTLPPYSQDTLWVTFQPTEVGESSGMIEVTTNGGDTLISLNGEGLAAPNMVLNPEESTLEVAACTDSVLVSFDIINGGEGTLNYSIAENSDREITEVLTELDANHQLVTDLVPSIHLFSGGETGTSISDGGGDMYDGGNYLNTNYQSSIPYTASEVLNDEHFGSETQYFTAKYPGLFVLTADLNDLEYFSVTGNLGADGSGEINGLELTYSPVSGTTYRGFVTRVFNSGDPSINHLIISKDIAGLGHTYLATTANEDHVVEGLNDSDRLYYLLFAMGNSGMATDAEMQQIFEEFIDIVVGPVVSEEIDGEVLPGDTTTIEMYVNTVGLEEGSYEFPIVVTSNDPAEPLQTALVTVNVSGNSCGAFEAQSDESCSGMVYFTDQSYNNPTSWNWNFGDGAGSTDQNPMHIFESNGEYTVTLEVCNSLDCDTITQTVFIENTGGPIVPACTPFTDYFYSADYFISEVTFNETTNLSEGSDSGYEDFTCDSPIFVTLGATYPLNVTMTTNFNYDVKTWIDFNNDGIFQPSELVLDADNAFSETSGDVYIPEEAVVGQPLRMRVLADPYYTDPCDDLYRGEGEDYAVVISPLNAPPVANFSWQALDECQGAYQFTDISGNLPVAWSWDFGDGTTSTAQNPYHIYDSGGEYSVELTAFNGFGSHSYEVLVNVPMQGVGSIDLINTPVAGAPLYFEVPSDGVNTWEWNFGDGNSATTDVPNTSHTYAELGTYIVSVSTEDPVCLTTSSSLVEITTSVGINLVDGASVITVFPNPTRGDLSVVFPTDLQIEELSIFNAIGQQIQFEMDHPVSGTARINLRGHSAGVYFLKVLMNNGLQSHLRIVVE